jgi:signal transduction histidine kinase
MSAGRRPRGRTWVQDVGVVVLLAVACGVVLTGRTGATVSGTDRLDWISVVLLPLPLIWRRRAPVVTFWAVIALFVSLHSVGAGSPLALIVPMVAVHTLARYRPTRYLVPGVAAIVLTGALARLSGEATWVEFAAVGAVFVAVALLGTNQRTRRSYLAEVEERAARLERERDQQAALAVAGERARIAREMHDIVAHNVAVMVALADGAAATAVAAPERAAGVMAQVSATGRQALTEMRRSVGLLRRPEFHHDGAEGGGAGRAPQPGFDDLDDLVTHVRGAGLTVAVSRSGTPGAWGPGAGLVVYRIVQEALTNTLKHAGPEATAEVRLRYGPDRVDVEVSDDGAGRPARPVASADRHGLVGMAERVGAFGGRVEAGPRDGAGWRVHADLRFAAGAE